MMTAFMDFTAERLYGFPLVNTHLILNYTQHITIINALLYA